MTPAADTRPPACGHAQPDRYPQQRDTPTAPGYASVFRGRAARVEVEDLGGPWRQRRSSGDRPHGLDIIQALTGPEGWGTQPDGTGGRITWARLTW